MKTTLLYGLLLGLAVCTGCAAAPDDHSGKDVSAVTDGTKQEMKDFFGKTLAGEPAAFASGLSFKPEAADEACGLVWDAWKEANAGFQEEKLVPLASLSNKTKGSWELPASLEPDAVMPYYWGTKGNGKPANGYPLFLYLHGSGDKNSEWATGLTICRRFADAPSAYFIPQIPNTGDYYRWWQKSKQFAWEKLLRLALVSGEIDPNRVYFFGISEGGYGSQRLASFYADYLAGAGPMAGGEPLKNAPAENCANIAFSLRTGAEDTGFYRNTLTAYTEQAFSRLAAEHPGLYTHNIELIPGMGHSINYAPTTPWLKEYARNPYPRYVNWEDFEMDGLRRKGFYNLRVVERPDENARTRYEMTVSDNRIDLKIDNIAYTTTETDPVYGIEMKFDRSYTPATSGKVVVYLNDRLADLSREVTLTVNGKEVFRGIPAAKLENMVNSCALFFDPERIFPAAIEVDLSKIN